MSVWLILSSWLLLIHPQLNVLKDKAGWLLIKQASRTCLHTGEPLGITVYGWSCGRHLFSHDSLSIPLPLNFSSNGPMDLYNQRNPQEIFWEFISSLLSPKWPARSNGKVCRQKHCACSGTLVMQISEISDLKKKKGMLLVAIPSGKMRERSLNFRLKIRELMKDCKKAPNTSITVLH